MEVEEHNQGSDTDQTKHNDQVVNENNVDNSTSMSLSSNDEAGSTSDPGDENEDDMNDEDDDECDTSDDYDYDDDYMYEKDDDSDYNFAKKLQAQFDNADLPAGVEASVSWLNDPASNPLSNVSLNASSASTDPLSKGSSGCGESSSGMKNGEEGDDIVSKYKSFKQFDIVDDCSDHHFYGSGSQEHKPQSAWTKKITEEWKILEKDLPDTIYVRVYESRMDLLRAVIVGPQGTPYHDGLFVFDVSFPLNYPAVPPMVYYYSGGLRLNPNLYDTGKVCLSLLNTWTGQGNEKWLPGSSTMLQVLVSIQALILNANPFFNEPGYESQYTGEEGKRESQSYSEDAFILSLKTMIYTIRRPPKHFEVLVAGHFRIYAHDILSACSAYIDRTLIGSLVNGKIPDGNVANKGGSSSFAQQVKKMVNGLVSTFTRIGVPDCEKFRCQS